MPFVVLLVLAGMLLHRWAAALIEVPPSPVAIGVIAWPDDVDLYNAVAQCIAVITPVDEGITPTVISFSLASRFEKLYGWITGQRLATTCFQLRRSYQS